ncbi:hypothetical protein [Dactylosporangium matsuzakiense]|uniref:hypothetical protein n=1 Tax=Dactylosporangium matsuzakiense TaxID=53360 RepID=UPI0021C28472|nr:hypothetical protein [Dactylosporangium matsuzakiense]UWZ44588.1 hypothetical protein Dmats_45835 [Dactylosporangium matsuzakiense]
MGSPPVISRFVFQVAGQFALHGFESGFERRVEPVTGMGAVSECHARRGTP